MATWWPRPSRPGPRRHPSHPMTGAAYPGMEGGASSTSVDAVVNKPACIQELNALLLRMAGPGVGRDWEIQSAVQFGGAGSGKPRTFLKSQGLVELRPATTSTRNHAQNPRQQFTSKQIHPSALPITKSHALEAVTLNLHRQAQNRQRAVLGLVQCLSFVLHAATYAAIRERAHFIAEYVSGEAENGTVPDRVKPDRPKP